MTEFWKSLPKKHCDFCKCWIADNKASVNFHEGGKRHQDNVRKKIKEVRKKGEEDFLAKKELDDSLKAIENAALKAFQKDLQRDDNLAHQYGVAIKPIVSQIKKEPSTSTCEKTPVIADSPQWYECRSEEGYQYYYNTVTGESSWEKPDAEVILLPKEENVAGTQAEICMDVKPNIPPEMCVKVEQTTMKPQSKTHVSQTSKTHPKPNNRGNNRMQKNKTQFCKTARRHPVSSRKDGQYTITNFKPVESMQLKVDPTGGKRGYDMAYGKWTTVPDLPPPELPDLQLPPSTKLPTFKSQHPNLGLEEPPVKLRVKEKKVMSLGKLDEVVAFKKHKPTSSQRNFKQRSVDD